MTNIIKYNKNTKELKLPYRTYAWRCRWEEMILRWLKVIGWVAQNCRRCRWWPSGWANRNNKSEEKSHMNDWIGFGNVYNGLTLCYYCVSLLVFWFSFYWMTIHEFFLTQTMSPCRMTYCFAFHWHYCCRYCVRCQSCWLSTTMRMSWCLPMNRTSLAGDVADASASDDILLVYFWTIPIDREKRKI